MAIHTCSDCGLVHESASERPEDPAVAIARIEADNRLAIEKIRCRTDREVAEAQAEAVVDATEAEADADLAVAAVQADALTEVAETAAEMSDEPAIDPVVVVEDASDEPEAEEPPEAGEQHHEPAPRKSRGLGMW